MARCPRAGPGAASPQEELAASPSRPPPAARQWLRARSCGAPAPGPPLKWPCRPPLLRGSRPDRGRGRASGGGGTRGTGMGRPKVPYRSYGDTVIGALPTQSSIPRAPGTSHSSGLGWNCHSPPWGGWRGARACLKVFRVSYGNAFMFKY